MTTAEVREAIIETLHEMFGEELPASLHSRKRLAPRLQHNASIRASTSATCFRIWSCRLSEMDRR